MTKMGLQTPKGFRDFLPTEMQGRALLLEKIKKEKLNSIH